MHRPISMMVLVRATILGILTMLVIQHPGAATTPTRGIVSATDASDIDAAAYERAPVTVDGRVLFQVRGLPAYSAEERACSSSLLRWW